MTAGRLLALVMAAHAIAAAGAVPLAVPALAAPEKSGAGDRLSDKELRAFARAAREVFHIRQSYAPKVRSAKSEIDARKFIGAAEKAMGEAIGQQGMTVARYNAILKAAQRDPSLASRIQAMVDREAAGDAARDADRK